MGQSEKRFLCFMCLALVITTTHLLNSLEKRKKSKRQTTQGTCSKCYGEDGGEDCLKGTEMTSEKKNHLLSQTVRS